jgi:hypothetical protein
MCSEWIFAEFGSGNPPAHLLAESYCANGASISDTLTNVRKMRRSRLWSHGLIAQGMWTEQNSVGVVAQGATETLWASWMTFTASSFGLRQYVGKWARNHGTTVVKCGEFVVMCDTLLMCAVTFSLVVRGS